MSFVDKTDALIRDTAKIGGSLALATGVLALIGHNAEQRDKRAQEKKSELFELNSALNRLSGICRLTTTNGSTYLGFCADELATFGEETFLGFDGLPRHRNPGTLKFDLEDGLGTRVVPRGDILKIRKNPDDNNCDVFLSDGTSIVHATLRSQIRFVTLQGASVLLGTGSWCTIHGLSNNERNEQSETCERLDHLQDPNLEKEEIAQRKRHAEERAQKVAEEAKRVIEHARWRAEIDRADQSLKRRQKYGTWILIVISLGGYAALVYHVKPWEERLRPPTTEMCRGADCGDSLLATCEGLPRRCHPQ